MAVSASRARSTILLRGVHRRPALPMRVGDRVTSSECVLVFQLPQGSLEYLRSHAELHAPELLLAVREAMDKMQASG